MIDLIYLVSLWTGIVIINYTITLLLKKVKRHSLVNRWMLAFLYAARAPFQLLVLFGGCFVTYDLLGNMYSLPNVPGLEVFQKLTVSLPFLWFLFRLKKGYERLAIELQKRKELVCDLTLLSVISKVSTVLITLFSLLTLLHIAGIPLQSLMIFGGAVSIAFGLASQNVIANFFGGLMVYINRPFKVGNWIKSPDKEIEGVVEEIGWYTTRIRTFDRKIVYVPNSLFTQIILTNPSQMYNRRIRPKIGIRYQDADKMKEITQDIDAMLRSHKEIDQEQYIMVHWIEFGPYSLDIDVYAFTKTTDWKMYRSIQQDVFLKIVAIVTKHGAEIAFPTQDLHIKK